MYVSDDVQCSLFTSVDRVQYSQLQSLMLYQCLLFPEETKMV